eukprot:gene2225-33787_t
MSTIFKASNLFQFGRFGRVLSQVDGAALEGVVPLFLIPTMEPELCTGPDCCQADDYASPFRMRHLNVSKTIIADEVITTFYMRLTSQFPCSASIDAAGCCNSDIQNVWVDVDPNFKVLFATFDGSIASVAPEQSQLGFNLKLTQPIQDVSGTGVIVTITVGGDADALCALSDMAPVKGLCNIIVEGAGSTSSCCPHSLSQASVGDFIPSPTDISCVSNAAAAGFDLMLQSVTTPFVSGSDQLSNYTFVIQKPVSCDGDAANTCCSMDINTIEVETSLDVLVESVEIAGANVPFVIREGAANTNTLVVGNLRIVSNFVLSLGMPMIVTVKLPSGAIDVPHLCPAVDNTLSYGSCTYSLHSTNNFCCPTSETSNVLLGSNVLSPPPPMPPLAPGEVVPPPSPSVLAAPPPPASPPPSPAPPPPSPPPSDPSDSPTDSPTGPTDSPTTPGQTPGGQPPVVPGTCQPTTSAPVTETSMGIQYYEGPQSLGSSTSFVFMVSNHNSAQCTKAHCQDVCGWTLFINPALADALSFVTEDSAPDNGQVVASGANASVTFQYGPLSEGTLLYSVMANRRISLEQLCRRNALPGQGAKECAAIVRGPEVYSVVFFDQSDVIITSPATPLPSQFCSEHLSLADSCAQIDSATYNSASGSTVFDFVVRDQQQPNCIANTGLETRFMVLLSGAASTQLSADAKTEPPSAFVIAGANGSPSGVVWPWASSTEAVHHSFLLSGIQTPSEACAQGVLEGQAPGSCVVAVMGDDCFTGYVVVNLESSLKWRESEGGGSSSSATIGIAVGVTFGILLLAVLAFFALAAYRRRKTNNNAAADQAARNNMSWDSFDNLAAPLNTGMSADLSQGSEVQVRLPPSSSSPVRS